MQQAIEGSHRANICKEPQLLPHSQQSLFRAYLGRGIVVVLQVAHGSKEHGVGTHAGLVGAVGIRVANSFDGVGTADSLFVLELVSALLGYGIEYSHTLFHNLGAYTVARENGNS